MTRRTKFLCGCIALALLPGCAVGPDYKRPDAPQSVVYKEAGDWQPATLARVEGMTDFTTRTRTAHLAPAGDRSPEPGAFARVRLESAGLPGPRLALLPLTSVVRRGALTGGYVVDGDRAVLRWLSLGREQGDAIEVLSGLFPGERVIRHAAGVADGARVRVRS